MRNLLTTLRPKITSGKNRLKRSWGWCAANPWHIALACLVVFSIWGLVFIPRWQANNTAQTFQLENKARKTLTQIILGVFGLIALYLTWRRIQANDRSVEIQQQGHITDRYTKAIEQLGKVEEGKPNIEVRLGAIYALERLAKDSPRDHWTIFEVLSAYVRRNAPAPSLNQDGKRAKPPEPPRTDIQAILTVIGRRNRDEQREPPGRQVNLCSSDLSDANLTEAHMEDAILGGAHLERAALGAAHLEGAFLPLAHLEGAVLLLAHLERADLTGAHLEGAFLPFAHLERAILRQARLEHANLREARLERALLLGAHLEGANLIEANLEGADLTEARLERALLLGAHLEGANLTEANLGGADLTGAHLEGADLKGANLEGADLRGVHLERAIGLSESQVKTALNWEQASFSPGFLDEETGGKHDDKPEKNRSEPPERPEVHGAEDS